MNTQAIYFPQSCCMLMKLTRWHESTVTMDCTFFLVLYSARGMGIVLDAQCINLKGCQVLAVIPVSLCTAEIHIMFTGSGLELDLPHFHADRLSLQKMYSSNRGVRDSLIKPLNHSQTATNSSLFTTLYIPRKSKHNLRTKQQLDKIKAGLKWHCRHNSWYCVPQ